MLLTEAKELIEFMEEKGLKPPILKENGALVQRDEQTENDIGNF